MGSLVKTQEFYSADAETVIISDTITQIGDYQFYGFSKIAELILPEGVSSIGNEAFAYCGNLSALVIPKSVTNIGQDVILGSKSVTEIYYGGSAEDWSSINVNAENTELNEAKKHYYAQTEADVSA